jgi:hypothetical protein
VKSKPSAPADWAYFVAWAVIGGGFCVAVLGALTIGIFVLPVAMGAAILLGTRRRGTTGVIGAVGGLGLPLLYVAYLNRDGPGNVCHALRGGGGSCSDEWDPWPFLVVGVALVVLAAVLHQRHRGRDGSRTVTPAPGANDR